ncbi:homoserine acetyltransferase [Infundibulicybe gibba]|nr:homoserine acetyltransferase [Infundibulicybe gibba]
MICLPKFSHPASRYPQYLPFQNTNMFSESKTQFYHHGRFRVAGGSIPDAVTAYRTYGDPENPCIVFPTCYGGRLDSQEYMVGSNKVLDPTKYFVVTFALFSNGESSSPSNTPEPYNGPYFPAVSYEDNIRAQYAVLTQKLGIKKLHMAIGFSMGGQQAYHWAVVYPDFVERYVVICGSARTSPHNQCFLEGPKAALVASKDFDDGHYRTTPQHGIRAFGRVYSAWAYGQTWFREYGHLRAGLYPDLTTFLREEWELGFLKAWDANDMLTLLATWNAGDVSGIRDGGDLGKCLSAIKAKGLIMPSKSDLYFPPEDSETEVSFMKNTARLVVIDTVYGHMAGGGSNSEDDIFIQAEVRKFLEE